MTTQPTPPLVKLGDVKKWLRPGDRLRDHLDKLRTFFGYDSRGLAMLDEVAFTDATNVALISPRWELVPAGAVVRESDVLISAIGVPYECFAGSLGKDRWRLTRDEPASLEAENCLATGCACSASDTLKTWLAEEPRFAVEYLGQWGPSDVPLRITGGGSVVDEPKPQPAPAYHRRATRKDVRVGMRINVEGYGGTVAGTNGTYFFLEGIPGPFLMGGASETAPVDILSEPESLPREVLVTRDSLRPGDLVEYMRDENGSDESACNTDCGRRQAPFTVVGKEAFEVAQSTGIAWELKSSNGITCYAPGGWTMRLLSRGPEPDHQTPPDTSEPAEVAGGKGDHEPTEPAPRTCSRCGVPESVYTELSQRFGSVWSCNECRRFILGHERGPAPRPALAAPPNPRGSNPQNFAHHLKDNLGWATPGWEG